VYWPHDLHVVRLGVTNITISQFTQIPVAGSITNKNLRGTNSLPINSTNFKKVLVLGLVLVSKDSRVHNLNFKKCVVLVFLYCAFYS